MKISYTMNEIKGSTSLAMAIVEVTGLKINNNKKFDLLTSGDEATIVAAMTEQGFKFEDGQFHLEITEDQFLQITKVMKKYVKPIGRAYNLLVQVYAMLGESFMELAGDLKAVERSFKK